MAIFSYCCHHNSKKLSPSPTFYMASNKTIYKEKDHMHPIYILEDPNASTEERPVNNHGLPLFGLEEI